MRKLLLLRHGQSTWNQENRFTGWQDVPLSEKGRAEAREAGRRILAHQKETGSAFDMAFTSLLKRAIGTLWLALEEMDRMWIPIVRSWRLNERHYGSLTGLNKAETAEKHGEEQVLIWRRSFDVSPPPFEPGDERNPALDERYQGLDIPKPVMGESLADTVTRFLPYWNHEIAPAIEKGRNVIVAAHGNSLRALVMHLDGLSQEDVLHLNIPTGIPLVYELEDDLDPIRNYYLADDEELKSAQAHVAAQGKAK